MTPGQHEVLNAVREYWEENGHSPSITNVMEMVGTHSRNRVQQALTSLRNDGLVTWTKGTNRTLRLIEHDHMERRSPAAG